MLVCAVGVSMAEPEPEPTQYYHQPAYKSGYHQPHYPSYHKPAYPSHGYPSHGYPAYPSTYDYCDPKAAPKCAENSTLPWCLADEEYPVHELKVPS